MRTSATSVLLGLLCSASAATADTIIYDNFPTAASLQDSVPLFGMHEWQSVALPFTVTESGVITKVETGIGLQAAELPLSVGIAQGPLVGATRDDLAAQSMYAINVCGPKLNPGIPCYHPTGDTINVTLQPDELLTFAPNLAVGPGTYWLYAVAQFDSTLGYWLASQGTVSDNWAIHGSNPSTLQGVIGNPDATTWMSVADAAPCGTCHNTPGAGPYAEPAARISFAVPEPASVTLLLVTLAGAAVRVRRYRC